VSVKNPDALDEATDARAVAERLPHHAPGLQHLSDLRASLDDFTWYGASKVYGNGSIDMRRVASIPVAVLNLMLDIDPTLLMDRERFYGWLRKHPEYSATRKVPRC
jgi:hypothetical protein